MDLQSKKVTDLKRIAKGCGLRGYSRWRKDDLIENIKKVALPIIKEELVKNVDEINIANIITSYLTCSCGEIPEERRKCSGDVEDDKKCNKECCENCSDYCDYFTYLFDMEKEGEKFYFCEECCEDYSQCSYCEFQICEFKSHKLEGTVCCECDEFFCGDCVTRAPDNEDDEDFNLYCPTCWEEKF